MSGKADWLYYGKNRTIIVTKTAHTAIYFVDGVTYLLSGVNAIPLLLAADESEADIFNQRMIYFTS